jgi:hypothetical protein
MKRFAIGLLVAVAVHASCHADVTKLSAEHRKVLQDSSRFREVHAATNLPPAVVALCADQNGRLAEPGQKWEVTDVVTDPNLPWRRLIWAASAGDYYVVHYERGGYAHSYHILVATFKPNDKEAKIVWRGDGDRLSLQR